MSVGDASTPALADLLGQAPSVAVLTEDVETTRDELERSADAIAGALRDAGVAPGQVVAVRLPNRPVTVAALFGVWRAGAVYAPFNPRAALDEVRANLDAVRPAALLTTPDAVGELATDFTGAVHEGDGWVVVGQPALDPVLQDADVALIQFTSGTTGRPKPVPLRHSTVHDMIGRVVASIRGARPGGADGGGTGHGNDAASVRPPMPNLVPVSLSLWAGIYQVLFAYSVSAPVVLMDRFDTAAFARLVARFGIRSTVLPPAAMTMLTDDPAVTDLAPLKMIRSITAPLSPVQARRFRDRFGVVVLNSYGQTELGGEVVGWTAADSRAHGEAKLGSVGRPHGGVEVRADDETGELLVRTPATAGGNLAPQFADRLGEDGWFHTGDLGRVDEDGFVWIEGRVSDMINRGGLKVFPAHVEEALVASPAVRDVAVVGVPDDRLGEVPWAFVVPEPGAEVDADALDAWCRERLSPYKVPVRFVAVDALPRNEVGKVLKRELVDRATTATTTTTTQP